jgi:hypothetical protein
MSQAELAGIVGDEDPAAALWFVALAIVIALPYGLRRVAKSRKDEGVETGKPRTRTTGAIRTLSVSAVRRG